MRAKDIKTRTVIMVADAAMVGSVDDVLFDPHYQRVVGFLLKGINSPGSKVAVPRTRIAAIGRDTIAVPTTEDLGPVSRFSELRDARSLIQARGANVVTEDGEMLGVLDGFELDEEALEVRACALATPLLDRTWHRQEAFEPQHIRQVGDGGQIMVDNAALHGSESEEDELPGVGTQLNPGLTQ